MEDHGEEIKKELPFRRRSNAFGKESYLADIEAGFDLLMIDPTKDPFEVGKVIPLEIVIKRTVELIEFCENVRKERNLPEIGYEVGTEANGGLTSTETYETFINRLADELTSKDLPMPTFIVGTNWDSELETNRTSW